jgi:lactate permease
VVRAWVPWVLLSLLVFVWGIKAVKDMLNVTAVSIEVPELHERIKRTPPVVAPSDDEKKHVEKAVYNFNWLSATGTAIFIAGVIAAFWLGIGPRRFVHLFLLTAYRMRWPLFTIACMLAIAYTTRYSGMDATLGLAFTATGVIYPFFAALLGWLGVALTGSDTSANALFGSLQRITGENLARNGVLPLTPDQAAILLASANSTGGVMGKMIDAQSIVVSAAATDQPGQEGPILRFIFLHSLFLACLMGLLVLAQAYWLRWMIP